MPRGKPANVGERMTSQNGYQYIRTERGWRLEHHVIAEAKFGRSIDTEVEMVFFIDGNRKNLSPSNIDIRPKKAGTKEARKAILEARIEELQAQLEEVEAS